MLAEGFEERLAKATNDYKNNYDIEALVNTLMMWSANAGMYAERYYKKEEDASRAYLTAAETALKERIAVLERKAKIADKFVAILDTIDEIKKEA